MQFIVPPSNPTPLDFSDAQVYYLGDKLTIYWTEPPTGIASSILLWQANRTTGVLVGDKQYITQSVVNKTDVVWPITTDFNLTLSNLFQLTLYQEGEVDPVDFSQYLYLENKADSVSASISSPSSSLLLSSTASATTSSSSAGNSIQTSVTTAVPIPSSASPASSFPTSAKIGVGVGIPVALLLGLIVGFLLFRHHKKKGVDRRPKTPSSQVSKQYKYGHYAPPLNEAPPDSLIELDPQHAAGVHAHKPPNDGAPPVRYEM
ncbi:hypothetical protein GT037_007646 [Alternaria burnsii]|uniref:Mid2 domain-containing protein n=1 Tax=Alternaria burnsii TaxID=1187904 RepID=A0A8H7AYG8_9PLEO|nr:uncharacterized protein GT037_007646 [Alternaria burnsii]KAF7673880.1 hypothetical protein GT037_007646 [Alternaria burnsii]CAI9635393.1 unnamed protein product [Alternaria burnsii]